jgi:sigma-54 dependent transcriptional regulator, acetoin dehydrogenase operon transcriptional activator AcoR
MLTPNGLPFFTIADYDSVISSVEKAWEQFVFDGQASTDLPRAPILESWKRSKQTAVPYDRKSVAKLELDKDQISAEKERRRVLFETISPHLQALISSFPEKYDMGLTFTDEKGIMLDCYCNKKTYEQFAGGNYIPGANWSEGKVGTNGIGLAIATGGPVHVLSVEHYCEAHKNYNCSSTPIRETVSGTLLGILTVTARPDIIPANNINWLINEACKIEHSLQGRIHKDASSLITMLFEMADQPGLIFNDSGEISKLNSLAKRILGAKTGERLSTVFDISSDQSPFLRHEQSFAVACRLTEQRMIATTSPLAIGEYVVGGIAFFRKEHAAPKTVSYTAKSIGTRYDFSSIVAKSRIMENTVKLAEKASHINATVLIVGETGTGKEVIAQSIHNNSSRRKEPFISVNCGAIPKELITTELFGYEEGAFTGAQRTGKSGKFEAAQGGTIFLDEIGDMPLDVQVYFLRILEERSITRLGSHKVIPVDVRVICATNKDLQQEVELGRFRHDLFYRINSIEIYLPPLRDRQEDILILAEHFLKRHREDLTISPGAREKLLGYSWPGNVRELNNVMERAAFLCDCDEITKADITLSDLRSGTDLGKHLQGLTPEYISKVLNDCHGNISMAAQRMQISRLTLYRKIKKYNLN